MAFSYKLITDSDLDGISCAVIGKSFFPFIDITYTTVTESSELLSDFIESGEIFLYDKIFITDLSIKPEIFDKLSKTKCAKNIVLIDHHQSSKQFIYMESDIVRHINHYDQITLRPISATEGFLRYLEDDFEDTYHDFIFPYVDSFKRYCSAVSAWDTFSWKENPDDELPVRLNMLKDLYDKEAFVDLMIHRIYTNDSFIKTLQEINILDYKTSQKKSYIEEKLSTMKVHHWDKLSVGIIFAEQYISEIGNIACERFPIKFAAIIDMSKKIVSLRTIDKEFSVAVLAKSFGGGGHSKAAGFVLSDNAMNVFIEEIF